MTRHLILLTTVLVFATPALALAQTTGSSTSDFSGTYAFQRDGVFGCNLNGSYAMSVGALSAVGGVYVPVNDAAVTLNTGYLVYKECVLRGIVDRMRESESSGIQKQILTTYVAGRGGQPYYSVNLPLEKRNQYFQTVVKNLGGMLGSLNPALQSQVTRAVAQSFATTYNRPNYLFACPYQGNLSQLLAGNDTSQSLWSGLGAEMNPGCNPYFAYTTARQAVDIASAASVNDMMTQLQWGQGTYPLTTTDVNGDTVVVTPGTVVLANTLQGLQTGFRQLENANDIDQMVGALFAGITSQVVGDNRGLAGLLQPTGGQPSYLDQVAKESSEGVRNAALNAAIQILTAAQQVETTYKAAMEAIANTLINTIAKLRGTENQCWNLIIQNVCQDSPAADKTCTAKVGACVPDPSNPQGPPLCPQSFKLKVATSTQFSQAVIDAQIAPLASTTAINIQNSAKALSLIAQLLAGVTNTTSLDAQRVALQQLDNLVAQHALHNQYDAQAAQQKASDLTSQMAQLIDDTTKLWADSTDTKTGWCNVQQQAVLSAWQDCWKQNAATSTCLYAH